MGGLTAPEKNSRLAHCPPPIGLGGWVNCVRKTKSVISGWANSVPEIPKKKRCSLWTLRPRSTIDFTLIAPEKVVGLSPSPPYHAEK